MSFSRAQQAASTLSWHQKYNMIVWDEFACHFDGDSPDPEHRKCRSILHYTREEAAALIARNYKVAGLKKSRADAIRSMILNSRY